jgi:hypothetical protein
MKSFVLIFLVPLVFSCTEKKITDVKKSGNPDKKSGIPKFEFDKELHDFGKITSGEILSYSFQFTNSGNSKLIIDKAEADCGCMNILIPNKTIAPGKSGIIEVQFNSEGITGKQLKTVEIHSNYAEPKHLIIFADVENEQIEIKY